MLVVFISVALVTATVYSVQAFDSMTAAYAEKATQADSLAIELAEKQALADTAQHAAQLSQEQAKALAEMLQKQREVQAAPAPQLKPATVVNTYKATQNANAGGPVFSTGYTAKPTRSIYFGWAPAKVYMH